MLAANRPKTAMWICWWFDYRGDGTDKAVEIRLHIPRKFPLDLIVRKPSEIRRRLAMKDSFVSTVIEEGKVLCERRAQRVDRQSRSEFENAAPEQIHGLILNPHTS